MERWNDSGVDPLRGVVAVNGPTASQDPEEEGRWSLDGPQPREALGRRSGAGAKGRSRWSTERGDEPAPIRLREAEERSREVEVFQAPESGRCLAISARRDQPALCEGA